MDGMFEIAAISAKRSTPAERSIIFWLIVLGSVGLGGFCLYLGFTADLSKAAEAAKLRIYGYCFAAFGLFLIFLRWIVCWLLDRWA